MNNSEDVNDFTFESSIGGVDERTEVPDVAARFVLVKVSSGRIIRFKSEEAARKWNRGKPVEILGYEPVAQSSNSDAAMHPQHDPLSRLIADANENSQSSEPVTLRGDTLLSTPPPPHNPVIDDVFDRGAVVEVIGPSKTRKSFLAMQLALGLASGRDICGLIIRHFVSVLIVNMELTPDDFHRRLWRMARSAGITSDNIEDRLTVLNLRDAQSDAMQIITNAVASKKYFGIIIDPIYPLLTGDESRPETWSPITGLFNRWATEYGFVLYVHHDAKGDAGERNIRDRGAGSGVAGRNAYARLTLDPHKDDPDNSIVVKFMLRGYAPHEGITLRFENDAFQLSDAAPTAQTAKDRKARCSKITVTPEQAIALVAETPLRATVFQDRLEKMGMAEKKARALRDELVDSKHLLTLKHGFPNATWYGTPSVIAALKTKLAGGES
jgi:hypothetical protein